jgi:hypothetical protein
MRDAEREGEPDGKLGIFPGIGKIWKRARGQKRETVMLWGGGGTSYDRVDPKFWLVEPIRHFISGCEFLL